MSLYGPRINLPKVDIPIPGNPSWNFSKEKKLALIAIVVIVIIALLVLFLPSIVSGTGELISNSMNPSIQVSWKNNPLDLTKEIKEAQMELQITNTTKQAQNVTFNITTQSQEIIIFCPNSLFDTNKGVYLLENLAPKDVRRVPCIVRRNASESVFSGSYTIEITSSLGNTKTILNVISK